MQSKNFCKSIVVHRNHYNYQHYNYNDNILNDHVNKYNDNNNDNTCEHRRKRDRR